ncbi:hypothetical protein L249_5531, partial [Ophiocordyceps polyrhachis-furcata BCC 54312]
DDKTLAVISTYDCKSSYLVPLFSFSFSIAPSAAPLDRAPGDTIRVLIIRPPFLLLLPMQSRNPSNRPYRRLYNPIRLGRNRSRPLYLLPPLLY